MKTTLLCVLCIEWTLRSADDLSGLNPRTGDYQEPQMDTSSMSPRPTKLLYAASLTVHCGLYPDPINTLCTTPIRECACAGAPAESWALLNLPFCNTTHVHIPATVTGLGIWQSKEDISADTVNPSRHPL